MLRPCRHAWRVISAQRRMSMLVGPAEIASSSSLFRGIVGGDRGCLARGITLIESSLPAHRAQADYLLDAVLEARGSHTASAPAAAALPTGFPRTFRIGFAGPPGAGQWNLCAQQSGAAPGCQKNACIAVGRPASPLLRLRSQASPR